MFKRVLDKLASTSLPRADEQPKSPELSPVKTSFDLARSTSAPLENVFHLQQIGAKLARGNEIKEIRFMSKAVSSLIFSVITNPSLRLITVACEDGLWFGRRDEPESIMSSIRLPKVTGCIVLGSHEAMLVVSDRNLLYYSAHDLVPDQVATPLQKIDSNVDFVAAGQLNSKTYVVYKTGKGSDTKVHVLEPVLKSPVPGRKMFDKVNDFNIASNVFDCFFLHDRLVFSCSDRWELLDVARFKSEQIPHPKKPNKPRTGTRKIEFEETPVPLAVFELTPQELLLCYTEYGIVLNRQSSQPLVSALWKVKSARAAFHPPYVLLFSASLIEVRHFRGLALVQLIQAPDIRCLSDGRADHDSGTLRKGSVDEWGQTAEPVDESRVYAVMNVSISREGGKYEKVQRIVHVCPV